MPINSDKFSQRFASLTVREQRMVVGTVLIMLWGGWDNFYYEPALKEQQQLENQIKQLNQQISALQAVTTELETTPVIDPNNQNRQSLSALELSINRLKNQLGAGEKRFVPAQLMASALRDMLKQHGDLQLTKLETLPPTAFGSSDNEPVWIYRHSMVITLQGDYFSTLNYLKSLEALPWRIHWDTIDYQVKDYPQAETRIQIYTLSFEQDWLRV